MERKRPVSRSKCSNLNKGSDMTDGRLRIKEEERAVIPPRAAVVADLMWIRSIVIDCPGPTYEASLRMEYVPMTEDGRLVEVGPNGESLLRQVGTETLYADINELTELAQAFGAILAAVKPMEALKDAQKAARSTTEEQQAEQI
jgi:hypothetical protein